MWFISHSIVSIPVPTPVVTFSITGSDSSDIAIPYSGQVFRLQCGIINAPPITGITAELALFKDSVEVVGTTRITANTVVEVITNSVFSRQYLYEPMSRIEDNGMYRCQGTIRPEDPSLQTYVTNAFAMGQEQTISVMSE